jgi:hypothetical protein
VGSDTRTGSIPVCGIENSNRKIAVFLFLIFVCFVFYRFPES